VFFSRLSRLSRLSRRSRLSLSRLLLKFGVCLLFTWLKCKRFFFFFCAFCQLNVLVCVCFVFCFEGFGRLVGFVSFFFYTFSSVAMLSSLSSMFFTSRGVDSRGVKELELA